MTHKPDYQPTSLEFALEMILGFREDEERTRHLYNSLIDVHNDIIMQLKQAKEQIKAQKKEILRVIEQRDHSNSLASKYFHNWQESLDYHEPNKPEPDQPCTCGITPFCRHHAQWAS